MRNRWGEKIVQRLYKGKLFTFTFRSFECESWERHPVGIVGHIETILDNPLGIQIPENV